MDEEMEYLDLDPSTDSDGPVQPEVLVISSDSEDEPDPPVSQRSAATRNPTNTTFSAIPPRPTPRSNGLHDSSPEPGKHDAAYDSDGSNLSASLDAMIKDIVSRTKPKKVSLGGPKPDFSSSVSLEEETKPNGRSDRPPLRSFDNEPVSLNAPKHVASVLNRIKPSNGGSNQHDRLKMPSMFGKNRSSSTREPKRLSQPPKRPSIVQRVVRSDFDHLVPRSLKTASNDSTTRSVAGSVADRLFGEPLDTPRAPTPPERVSPTSDEIESLGDVIEEQVQDPFGFPEGAFAEPEEVEGPLDQPVDLDLPADDHPMTTSVEDQDHDQIQAVEPPLPETPTEEQNLATHPVISYKPQSPQLRSASLTLSESRSMSLEWESRGAGPSYMANYFVNLGPSGREARPVMRNTAMAKAQILSSHTSRSNAISIPTAEKKAGTSSLRSDDGGDAIASDSSRRRTMANSNTSNLIKRKRKRHITSDDEDPDYMESGVKRRKGMDKRSQEQQEEDDQELFSNLDNLAKAISKKDEPTKDANKPDHAAESGSLPPEPEDQDKSRDSPARHEGITSPSSPSADRTESERDELEGDDEMSDHPDGFGVEDDDMDDRFESAQDHITTSSPIRSSPINPPAIEARLNNSEIKIEEDINANDTINYAPALRPGVMNLDLEIAPEQASGRSAASNATNPSGSGSSQAMSYTPGPASSVPPPSFTLPYIVNWEELERRALLNEFRDVLEHHPEFTGGYRSPGISPGYASWQLLRPLLRQKLRLEREELQKQGKLKKPGNEIHD
ncbi:hypothetical protein CPB86DRAFT_222226 [Serendipita vermifera]|nr:hypothetical protein CPB86DRAFT_222226 [Serendipita vermifera]